MQADFSAIPGLLATEADYARAAARAARPAPTARGRMESGIEYFIPPELRSRLALLDYLNPVSDVGRAMQSSERMMDPSLGGWERLGAAGSMLTDVASVVAPMAAGRGADGLLDAFAYTTMPADDAIGDFLRAQDGAVGLSTAEGSRRISTRLPTGAKATEDPLRQQLSMNFDEAIAGDVGAHNAGLLSGYPGFARLSGMAPEEAAREYVSQSADNLRFLIDRMPEGAIQETSQWYEGANRVSGALADRYGVPRQSSSAVIAALSPQKDWFQNASLAERLIDTYTNMADRAASPEMMAFMQQHPAYSNEVYQRLVAEMQGVPLAELPDAVQRAMYIRAFDEVNNPRNYRLVTPEGLLGDFVTNADGSPSRVAWGSFNEIGKGVQALETGGDMTAISPLLGERHKVRSFYNNIEDPFELMGAYGDVTGDTHAVAANQLRPLSGNTTAVAQNFGNGLAKNLQGPDWAPARGSKVTGVQGTYGFNTEPYRMIAEDYGLRPRAAQSVGWEAVRALFPDTFKTKRNMAAVDEIWRAADRGEIGINEARQRIFDLAGGLAGGNWGQPRSGLLAPEGASTFRR